MRGRAIWACGQWLAVWAATGNEALATAGALAFLGGRGVVDAVRFAGRYRAAKRGRAGTPPASGKYSYVLAGQHWTPLLEVVRQAELEATVAHNAALAPWDTPVPVGAAAVWEPRVPDVMAARQPWPVNRPYPVDVVKATLDRRRKVWAELRALIESCQDNGMDMPFARLQHLQAELHALDGTLRDALGRAGGAITWPAAANPPVSGHGAAERPACRHERRFPVVPPAEFHKAAWHYERQLTLPFGVPQHHFTERRR